MSNFTYIDCKVQGDEIICDKGKVISGDSVKVRAVFDESWAGLTKYVYFLKHAGDADETGEGVLENGELDVSGFFWDADFFEFGFVGKDVEGNIIKDTNVIFVKVDKGSYIVNPGAKASNLTFVGRLSAVELLANEAKSASQSAVQVANEAKTTSATASSVASAASVVSGEAKQAANEAKSVSEEAKTASQGAVQAALLVGSRIEKLPIDKGGGEKSLQQTGNNAFGDQSIALGYNSVSGLRGFYIKSIDLENKKIYLGTEKVTPEISTVDNTDSTFETPTYEIGDEFDLIVQFSETQRMHYSFVSAITSIEHNVIIYDTDLPFTEIYEDSAEYSPVLFVSAKPDVGLVDIGGYSTSEGEESIAAGKWSHAEGYGSISSGRFSHAEGRGTKAGYSAHSEGYQTIAKGQNSHAEGNKTLSEGAHSHAEGSYSKAIGDVSHAEGQSSTAKGDNSHAEEHGTTAEGNNSHSEGYFTTASGSVSHAEGFKTIASGVRSHAEGIETQAIGGSSHAEGSVTKASGEYSHAEGQNCTASGKGSHAEGYNAGASAIYSHAEGGGTIASGEYSHAEGQSCTASGNNSHVEGRISKSTSTASHAEGYGTTASGSASHAEGYKTKASGVRSHAEGGGTIASSEYQHVQGRYNVEDTENKYAHIVGNGTADDARSNAHTVDWDGNAWFAGDVKIGGAGQDDENAKTLATTDMFFRNVDLTSSGLVTYTYGDFIVNEKNIFNNTMIGSVADSAECVVNVVGYVEIEAEATGSSGGTFTINGVQYDCWDNGNKMSFKGVVNESISILMAIAGELTFTKFVTTTDYELNNKVTELEIKVAELEGEVITLKNMIKALEG